MGLINYTFFSHVLREQVRVSVVLPTYSRWNSKGPWRSFINQVRNIKLFMYYMEVLMIALLIIVILILKGTQMAIVLQ